MKFIAALLIPLLALQPVAALTMHGAGVAVALPQPTLPPTVLPSVQPLAQPATNAQAMATVQHGLSWLNESLVRTLDASPGKLSAAEATQQLLKAGATPAQAEILVQNQISKGTIASSQPAVEPAKPSLMAKAKGMGGQAANFALTAVGVRAGINLLSQAVNKEGIDLGKAFSFMGQPSFWTGTAGAFLGSTILSAVGSALIPGAGPILKTIPGFLGAAVGFEVGAGNLDQTNWTQLIASTAVSAAAFALIGGPIGIGASILAGMVVNEMFAKDEVMAPTAPSAPDWASFQPLDVYSPPMPVPDLPTAPALVPPPKPMVTGPAPVETPRPVISAPPPQVKAEDLQELMDNMQKHYQRYLAATKARNGDLAKEEYNLYSEAKAQLEKLRGR